MWKVFKFKWNVSINMSRAFVRLMKQALPDRERGNFEAKVILDLEERKWMERCWVKSMTERWVVWLCESNP